jgi:hypothetical protein
MFNIKYKCVWFYAFEAEQWVEESSGIHYEIIKWWNIREILWCAMAKRRQWLWTLCNCFCIKPLLWDWPDHCSFRARKNETPPDKVSWNQNMFYVSKQSHTEKGKVCRKVWKYIYLLFLSLA